MKRKNARVKKLYVTDLHRFSFFKNQNCIFNFQKAIETTKTAVMRRPNEQHHSVNNHFRNLPSPQRDLNDFKKDARHHHKMKANQKIITREMIEQFIDLESIVNQQLSIVIYLQYLTITLHLKYCAAKNIYATN